MTDNRGPNDLSNQSNCSESYNAYLNRAAHACEMGDLVLGMHLYLAAYEKAVADPDIPDGMALAGLREAWHLACDLKERSMAEYVFEKLEPFLTGEEIAHCANELQNLALDRLEEYGFSREELQDMAEMISQDLLDGEGSVVKVESISIPHVVAAAQVAASDSSSDDVVPEEPHYDQVAEEPKGKPNQAAMGVAAADGFNPYDEYNTSSVGMSFHAATNDGSGAYVFTRDQDRAAESERAQAEAQAEPQVQAEPQAQAEQQAAVPEAEGAAEAQTAPQAEAQPEAPATTALTAAERVREAVRRVPPPGQPLSQEMPAMPDVPEPGAHPLNYRTLAGYGEAVAAMRDMGLGLQRDPGFKNFIGMMNARHGLNRRPALDTLLFRAPIVEDATRFVDATIGEIGLPVLRMSMEEGMQGMPMLCVTTQGNSRPRMNHAHNRFDGPGILVIDDLDMWTMPQMPEGADGIAGFVMANMSRGAREAVNLIHSAVEDPDVYVLATASTDGEVDPFFYDLLEPITIIDISAPDADDRDQIWAEIMHEHPSMRELNRADLVRFSAGLPRYDIYMAARAAVEEAYKRGLAQRMYLPVTPQNVLDKLAACQPLDSDEYQAIEDEVARSFRSELDNLEDLVDGSVE